jgi:hypothetical protein
MKNGIRTFVIVASLCLATTAPMFAATAQHVGGGAPCPLGR